nr:MAG TPA: hypothetical protein [Caudoviricetes sp.]
MCDYKLCYELRRYTRFYSLTLLRLLYFWL